MSLNHLWITELVVLLLGSVCRARFLAPEFEKLDCKEHVVGDPLVWGDISYGGKVPTEMEAELHNITSAATTNHAFAALRLDGRVFAWGDKRYGGDPGSLANMMGGNVTVVAGTNAAFAALRNDSQVVAWGDRLTGGSLGAAESAVAGKAVEIHSTHHAFAALLRDGTVAAWGSRSFGGHISDETSALLQNVTCVKSSWGAFAALRADGVVVAWGDSQSGGDSSEVSSALAAGDVADLFANDNAFVALLRNGHVVAWGDWEKGGELPEAIVGSEINSNSTTVKTIYHTSQAFAALRTDGKVVTWGAAHRGGDSSMVQTQLVGVVDIIPSSGAFRAHLQDGSIVKWGDTSNTTVYTTGRGTTLHQYSTGRAELALITSRPECRYTDTVTTSTSSSISATSRSSTSATSRSSHSTPTSSMSTSTSTTTSTSSSPSSTQTTTSSGSGSTNTSSSTSTSSLSSSAMSPTTFSTNSSTPTSRPTSTTTSSHSSSSSTSATSRLSTSSSSTTEESVIVIPELSAMSFTISLTVEGEGGDASYDVALNFTNDKSMLLQIRVSYANNASVPLSSVTLIATALPPPAMARFLAAAGPNVRLDFQVVISSASATRAAAQTQALLSAGFQSILDEAIAVSSTSLSAIVVTVSELQVANHTMATSRSSSTSTATNLTTFTSSTSMSSTTPLTAPIGVVVSTASTSSTTSTGTDSTASTTTTSSSIARGVATTAAQTSSRAPGNSNTGWAMSEWGECSALCGEGTQSRETFCALDGNTCPPQARPATTRPCSKPCVVPVVVGAIVVIFVIVACVLIMQILICPRRRRKKQDKLKKAAAEALMHEGSGTDGSMSPKSPKRKKRVSGRSQAGQGQERPSSFVSIAPSSPTTPARDSISSPGGRGVGADQLRGGATGEQWAWQGDIDDWQMFVAETETTTTRTTNMTTTVDTNGPPLTFDEVPTELTVGEDEDFSGSDVSSSAYWQSSRPSRATTDGTRSMFESSRATGRSGRRGAGVEGAAVGRVQAVARGEPVTSNLAYNDVPDDLGVAPDDEDFSGSDVSSARWQSSRPSRATVEGTRTAAQGIGRRGGQVPVVGREGTAVSDLTFDDVPDDLVVAPEDDDQKSESDVSSDYVRTARAAIDAAKTRLQSPRGGVDRQASSPKRHATASASRAPDLRFEEVPDDLVVAPEDDDQESVSDVSSAYVQIARAAIEAARPSLEAREEARAEEGVDYWQMYAAYRQAVEPQLTFDEVPDDLNVAPECEDATSESDVSSAYVRTARAAIQAARPALEMGEGGDGAERRGEEEGGGVDRRATSRAARDPDDPELTFDDVPDDLIVAPDVDEELSESDVSSAYVRNARQGIEAARRRLEMLQARAFDDEVRRNSAGAWTEDTEDRALEYDDVPDGLSLPPSDAEEITDDGSMLFPDDIDLDYEEVPDHLGVPNEEMSDAEGSVRARSIGMSSSATMDNSISGSM